MCKTFEFGEWFLLEERDQLEAYLNNVWQQRIPVDDELQLSPELESLEQDYQGFLVLDGNKARAKNFIGFVQWGEGHHVDIYPKVFKTHDINETNSRLFLKHIFFWFDYCRKWKFPFTNVNLDSYDCDNLPELIINLIANQILSTIANNPLMQYEEIEESLSIPRGRINFSRYLTNGFINGNQHVLECDHEPLLYDNHLNQVIKYVARWLKNRTKFHETQSKLDEILFVLDDVSDVLCNSKSLNKIKLNSFFEEYLGIVDICKLILDQEIYSNQHYEQSHWSLLFPMEYIFEDFVAGFIEQEFSDKWIVEYQKSDLYLTDEPQKAFNMRHDILLTAVGDPSHKVIVDTKYKIRSNSDVKDKKHGITQSDMYQMVSYGLRRGCSKILLLYPNYSENTRIPNHFVISSGFDKKHKINITATEIPFWSINNFDEIRNSLKASLIKIFEII